MSLDCDESARISEFVWIFRLLQNNENTWKLHVRNSERAHTTLDVFWRENYAIQVSYQAKMGPKQVEKCNRFCSRANARMQAQIQTHVSAEPHTHTI